MPVADLLRLRFPGTSCNFPCFGLWLLPTVQSLCTLKSLCCPYTLPLDAGKRQDTSPSLPQVERALFAAPFPTPYAPDLKFCEWNMIPDHYFCDPSTKLAFTSEQHSATKIAFPCAHNILPPSFQTAELMMKGSDTSSVNWGGPSDSWKALNALATQMP